MHTSFWEEDALLRADFVIVGGGLIGLQTALAVRAQAPRAEILVLERGVLPSGASSRNAGFGCFGSLTEILADLALMGRDDTLQLIAQRWRGLQMLRALLGDAALGAEDHGGHELIRSREEDALERIGEVNRLLQDLFGKPVFKLNDAALRHWQFGPGVKAVVSNGLEWQLHSGKAMRSLRKRLQLAGIDVINGANVTAITPQNSAFLVHTDNQAFQASRVAVCTNGLIPALLPEIPVTPGRGQVLVTEPVSDLPFRGCFHVEQGYYYFRNLGQRVLLGGGRNLDFAAEATTSLDTTAPIQQALENLLHELILPKRRVRIEHRWSGLMGFTPDKQARVQRTAQGVVAGFGCNGMGVALSPLIAMETARLLLE